METKKIGSKSGQAGSAAVLVPILIIGFGLLIFIVFYSTLLSNPNGNLAQDDSSPGAVNYSGPGVTTDCLFWNKNPRVRSALASDPQFHQNLVYYASALGYNKNDMISVFRIECDFNWHVVNSFGCGGMFQLCPVSERVTGITGRRLATLPPSQQMYYMYRYFKAMGCDRDPPVAKTMTNAYLCVFLPGKRKEPPNQRIWKRGVNPLHDVDDDGWIYKWEVDCNMFTSYGIGSKSCGLNLPLCSKSKVVARKGDY